LSIKEIILNYTLLQLAQQLGQRGYAIGPPGGLQPDLDLLEIDDYGRILFYYSETYDISPANLVIVQRVEDNYFYVYPHYNFISRSARHEFTEVDIEHFKEENSWNQDMSDNCSFTAVTISRYKDKGPITSTNIVQAHHDIFPNDSSSRGQIIANTFF
jgi:hypothetical protein